MLDINVEPVNEFAFSEEEVLAIASSLSADDALFYSGSVADGLGYAYSDCDIYVLTSQPVPDKLRHGTKYLYPGSQTRKMDTIYFAAHEIRSLHEELLSVAKSEFKHLDHERLEHMWRIVVGKPIINGSRFTEVCNLFPRETVSKAISVWYWYQAASMFLEAVHVLEMDHQLRAYSLIRHAVCLAAQSILAATGDAYPSTRFTHEMSWRSQHYPNLFSDLWNLEIVQASNDNRPYLDSYMNFCRQYALVLPEVQSTRIGQSVPVKPTASVLLSNLKDNFLIWNKSEVFRASELVTELWPLLLSSPSIVEIHEALDGRIPVEELEDVISELETVGVVERDWLAAIDAASLGLVTPSDLGEA